MIIFLKFIFAALMSAAVAGCAARLPPTSAAADPADPAAPSAAHAPLRPQLLANAQTFLAPAAGARAREMEHSAHAHAGGVETPADQSHYTCPMHPEISLDKPGNCPVCGMTLIKKSAASKGGSR